jgi:hypothetical protein
VFQHRLISRRNSRLVVLVVVVVVVDVLATGLLVAADCGPEAG